MSAADQTHAETPRPALGLDEFPTIGEFDGKTASWDATVVPDSGTSEFGDLSGKGTFAAPMGSTAEFDLKLDVGA